MCCGDLIAKVFIFILCGIKLVVSLITLAIVIYALVGLNIMVLVDAFQTNSLSFTVYGIFGVLALILITSIFGILSICLCKKKLVVIIYIVLLVICILVTLGLAGLWYVYGAGLVSDAKDELYKSLIRDYKGPTKTDETSIAWNVIQLRFETCGVEGPEDWLLSSWYANQDPLFIQNYPPTCCKGAFDQIDIRDAVNGNLKESDFESSFFEKCYNENKVNKDGSRERLVPALATSIYGVGGLCLGLALFQLLAVVAGIVLVRSDKFGK